MMLTEIVIYRRLEIYVSRKSTYLLDWTMCMRMEMMAAAILTKSFPWSKSCSMSDKIAKVSLKNFSLMKIA